MSIVDQFYLVVIYVWSLLDKIIVSSAATAMVVAVLRMKRKGRIVWAEALLCGIFAAIILYGLDFLGSLTGIVVPNHLTQGASQVIAGAVGWYGTERTINFIEDKIGVDDNETDK